MVVHQTLSRFFAKFDQSLNKRVFDNFSLIPNLNSLDIGGIVNFYAPLGVPRLAGIADMANQTIAIDW